MIVSINQPCYLPWLGYFDRIVASDLHVVLDNVQFEKNSFINRNKIRAKTGWNWLSVPVDTSRKFGSLEIKDVAIASDPRWPRKHRMNIEQSYSHSPYFSEHAMFFERTYSETWHRLVDLIDHINSYLLTAFQINTQLIKASSLNARGRKSDLVLHICQSVGATVYLSGPLGRDYLDETQFRAAGIDLKFHDYRHPTYRQCYPGFEPCMSAVDLLFNEGPGSLGIMADLPVEQPV